MKRKKTSILFISLLLITMLLSGCGGSDKGSKGMELTAQKELNKLFSDPKAYKNKEVVFGGAITSKENKGSGDVGFAICNDLENKKTMQL